MMATRCKFCCQSKREYQHWNTNKPNLYEYEFMPVTGGSEENKQFFEATPTGSLKVSTVRDGSFEVGKSYYIDMFLAE